MALVGPLAAVSAHVGLEGAGSRISFPAHSGSETDGVEKPRG